MPAVFINNTGVADEDLNVTLDGQTYTLRVWFSKSTQSWNISTSKDDEVLIRNLRLVWDSVVTSKHDIVGFTGDFVLVKVYETPDLPGRDNVGVGLPYRILWGYES